MNTKFTFLGIVVDTLGFTLKFETAILQVLFAMYFKNIFNSNPCVNRAYFPVAMTSITK